MDPADIASAIATTSAIAVAPIAPAVGVCFQGPHM